MNKSMFIEVLSTVILFLVFFLPFITLAETGSLGLALLVFAVMLALHAVISYVEWEIEHVTRVLTSILEDEHTLNPSKLPFGIAWRLRGVAHEYDKVSKKIGELEEKETLCRYIQGFDKDMDCGLLEKRRRALESLREAVVAEIRNSLYRGFRKNTS